jgi:DNA-binding Lrp family transcriptional regulator
MARRTLSDDREKESTMDHKTLKQEILMLLQRNARFSDQEIADRLQQSPADIHALIREMEKDRTILGYSALIDEEKAGSTNVRAIIEVEVQPERDSGFNPVAEMLSKYPEVHSVYLVSGRYDLRVEVVGESLQEVAFFVASKLATLEGIKATATHFLLKKYKETGFSSHQEEKHERLKVVP